MWLFYFIINLLLIVGCIFSFKETKKTRQQSWKIQADCEQVKREQLQKKQREASKNPYGRN